MERTDKIKFLTVAEAAELADGISKYAIRKMVKEGTLPHFKSGNKIFIAETDLMEALRKKTPQKPDEAVISLEEENT